MTNYEYIKSFSQDEMVDFLNSFHWENIAEAFSQEFCNKCEPDQEKAKCETPGYICPHFNGDVMK
jgi:hypothetical protein